MIAFRVNGIAQQAGSKRAFVPKGWTRPILTDSNRNLKSWQQLVAECAHHALMQRAAAERGLLLGAVRLSVAFFLPRPKSLPRREVAHTKSPDLDKFVRAIQDALTGVIFRDDAQVVELIAMKRYAAAAETAHADVRIEASAGVEQTLPLFQEVKLDGQTTSRNDETERESPIPPAARHGGPANRRPRAGRDRLRGHP
jgi:Holliday junction resolvase RusA-like endonuclease